MPFSATGSSGEFHYLAEIVLNSTVLRYADEDIAIQTNANYGEFYQGRLPETARFSRSLGSYLEAKEVIDNFGLSLNNRDGAIQTLVKNNTFANKTVRILAGVGVTRASYSTMFVGKIATPNGIRWDEDSVEITVIDRRILDRRILPIAGSVYDDDTFPNMEQRSKGKEIPIVIGNWSSAASQQLTVPCVCIDTTIPKFKFASHGILGIDRFVKNSARVEHGYINNIDLSEATFEFNGLSYNATNDIVSVNCCGIATVNNTLIQNPIAIYRMILSSYMGLTTADFDMTAIDEAIIDTGSDTCRRVIQKSESTETLLSTLLNEANVDPRFVGGKYAPKFRERDIASARTTVYEHDIIVEDDERAKFELDYDPERLLATTIRGNYRYNPIDERFEKQYTVVNETAEENYGTRYDREMNFFWYFDRNQVQARVDRDALIFSEERRAITLSLSNRFILKNLADQIDLDFNIFEGDPVTFSIRDIDIDFYSMTVLVSGLDIFSTALSNYGKWTSDSHPDYTSSSAEEKLNGGYWTDANGEADPGDAESLYTWF